MAFQVWSWIYLPDMRREERPIDSVQSQLIEYPQRPISYQCPRGLREWKSPHRLIYIPHSAYNYCSGFEIAPTDMRSISGVTTEYMYASFVLLSPSFRATQILGAVDVKLFGLDFERA